MHVALLNNVVYPLTFKLLIHVMGCDIFLSITYDGDDDVGIFAVGVGAIPKSPYVGHKNSLVLIVKIPVSNNNVVLNFNSSCLKYSWVVIAGVFGFLRFNGAFTSNLSCFKSNASTKPAVDTTPLVTAIDDCRPL